MRALNDPTLLRSQSFINGQFTGAAVLAVTNPATGQVDGSGLKAPAPDIHINGRISNRRGSIDLTASYGSIYANADILTIHVDHQPENLNHHLVDAVVFSKMKPTALLINTSRGEVVNPHDLATALKTHRLAGAGHEADGQRGRAQRAQERAGHRPHPLVDHVGGEADQPEGDDRAPRRPGADRRGLRHDRRFSQAGVS